MTDESRFQDCQYCGGGHVETDCPDSSEYTPSKPTLKDVVDGTPESQAAIERAIEASIQDQAKFESSKLDEIFKDFDVLNHFYRPDIEKTKRDILTMTDKIIGPDEVCKLPQTPENVDEFKKVAIRNQLRAEQRLRKDAL